jgi:hypothetical protein
VSAPDGLCTVEEMRASFPYCPTCKCDTIPVSGGQCAFCGTWIVFEQEEDEAA